MRREEAHHAVVRLCGAVEVSRSGYYAWRRRRESVRARTNRRLLEGIRETYEGSRRAYGAPRVHQELAIRGQRCGRHRVARLMRRHGLAARRRRRYRVTTRAAHGSAAAPNLLAQRFTVNGPNRVWVADITYVPTREGWLYLAVVLDLFARRVVGWATGATMTRQLVIDALQVALGQRSPKAGLIHHSDRGSQYASTDYQVLLERHGLRASMSAKGNCYDNAVAESFFHTLKTELVHRHRFATRRDAHAHLFEYIEGFYNRQRRHSALGYATPVEFEERHDLR